MAEEQTKTEITLEQVQTFLTDNEDGTTWFNQQKDSAVSKGVSTFENTFAEKHKVKFMKEEFPALLETEVEKRLPAPETDEAKRLKELEIKFTQSELDKDKANLQTTLLKVANTEKIPTFFVDYALAQDEDTSIQRLKDLGKKYVDTVNEAVEDRLKGKGRPAPGTGTDDDDNITINSVKDIINMDDITKNKTAIEALLKKANS